MSNRINERKDRFTDKELLDFLQTQTDKKTYTGKVVFRWSRRKHGWRLQETHRMGAKKDVREAIADAMKKSGEGNSVNRGVSGGNRKIGGDVKTLFIDNEGRENEKTT